MQTMLKVGRSKYLGKNRYYKEWLGREGTELGNGIAGVCCSSLFYLYNSKDKLCIHMYVIIMYRMTHIHCPICIYINYNRCWSVKNLLDTLYITHNFTFPEVKLFLVTRAVWPSRRRQVNSKPMLGYIVQQWKEPQVNLYACYLIIDVMIMIMRTNHNHYLIKLMTAINDNDTNKW